MITRKIIAVGTLLPSSLLLSACITTTSSHPATPQISSISASTEGIGMGRTDVGIQQDQHVDDTEKHNLEILRFVRGF